MTRRGLFLGLVALALIGGGAAIYMKRAAAPREATAAKATAKPVGTPAAPVAPTVIELSPADLAVAETREIRRELPLTGQVRPVHQAYVRAKVAGEVMEMRVKEGEALKAGQLIARLDPAEYQARLDERLATLAAARATWENSERTRRNNEELLRKNFISQQAYDNTLANADVARAQVKAAEANVALAKKSVDDTVVRAPWGGQVAERLAQVGDKAAIDMRLINLVDLSRVEVEAGVPAGDIPAVAIGQAVDLRVEGFAGRAFTGRIARIAPQAAPGSRSLMVYVEIANPDLALKGGMFAKGALTLGSRAGVIAVPVTALREERGETVIYAITDGKLARLPVKVGARNDEEAWAEVVSGVAAGTRVVKTNLGTLSSGLPVKVAATGTAAAEKSATTATAATPAAPTVPTAPGAPAPVR
jgi:RND family efflux transporter MFP subunit